MRFKQRNTILVDVILCLIMLFLLHPFYMKQLYYIISAIYILAPILYGGYNFIRNGYKLNRKISTFVAFYLVHFNMAFIAYIINWSDDLTYPIELIENFVKILAFSMFTVWTGSLYRKRKCRLSYPEIFLLGVGLYAISTLFFLIFPEFKNPWIDIIGINSTVKGYSWVKAYATRFSIAGWSSFHGSYFAGFSIICLMWSYSEKIIKAKFFLVAFGLNSLACIFYGRFGIMMEIIILGLYILLSLNAKVIQRLIIIVPILITFAIIAIAIIPENEVTDQVIQWMTEPIRFFLSGDKNSSASLRELSDMYNMVVFHTKDLLIGNGRWINKDGSYYGHIDVGFFRNLYYGGLLYTLTLYAMIAYYTYFIAREISIRRTHTNLWFILLFVFFLFGEAKGDTVFYYIKLSLPLGIFAQYYRRNPNNVFDNCDCYNI